MTTNVAQQQTSEKFYVGLGATIDVSRWESFSLNEKIQELGNSKGLVYFEVSSLKEASDLTRKFIKDCRLGASHWIGGIVLDDSLNFKAYISYNGRVWDNEDWKIAKEIKIC
jgi:hypothetical protein